MKKKTPPLRAPIATKSIQLKVTLKYIQPPIWRRLVVTDNCLLYDLHWILQAAMGWDNSHLHAFRIGAVEYVGPESTEADPEAICDEDVLLSQVIERPKQKFTYLYDFGDGWNHEILIEKIEPLAGSPPKIQCLAGARACPPEDCGGPPGYQSFLAAKRDPNPKNLECWGEPDWVLQFDPERFDLTQVNQRL